MRMQTEIIISLMYSLILRETLMLIVNALIEKQHFAESAVSLRKCVPGLFVCVCMYA